MQVLTKSLGASAFLRIELRVRQTLSSAGGKDYFDRAKTNRPPVSSFSAFDAQHPVQLGFCLRGILKKDRVHAHCPGPLQVCLDIVNKHTSGRVQLILFDQKPEEAGIRLDHVEVTGKEASVHFRQKI